MVLLLLPGACYHGCIYIMHSPIQVRWQVHNDDGDEQRYIKAQRRREHGEEEQAKHLVDETGRGQALGAAHRRRLIAVITDCDQQSEGREPPAQPIRQQHPK